MSMLGSQIKELREAARNIQGNLGRCLYRRKDVAEMEEVSETLMEIADELDAMTGGKNPDGLPYGLTISDDGDLLNWRGENYVRHTVDNGEADSREQLEADVYQAAEEMKEFTHGEKFINTNKILRWLDRQAAITRAEWCNEQGWWDSAEECNRATAKVHDMQEQVDSLTAERDELQSIIDHMPRTEAECEACQEAHDRLMYNAKVDMDKLREQLADKQHVCDVQRDSFLAIEAENGELRRALDAAGAALDAV